MKAYEQLRAFLEARAVESYVVGGAIRDKLLGRETHDLDVSIRSAAAPLAREFADANGGAYFVMDAGFDVARIVLDEGGTRETLDLARLRGDSIEDDLATRDFTINAMAANFNLWNGDPAAVVDPFLGREDLAGMRVRAVTPEAFRDDPVRLLRAVRMEAELGFSMDEATAALVRRDAPLLAGSSAERVREEFVRTIALDGVRRNLERLDEFGLLGHVLPEVEALRGVTQSPPHVHDVFTHTLDAAAAGEAAERERYAALAGGKFQQELVSYFALPVSTARTRRELFRVALLLHDIGKPSVRTMEADGRIRFIGHEIVGFKLAESAMRRLRFGNDDINDVKSIIQYHLRPIQLAQSGLTPRALFRYIRDTGAVGPDIAVHAWCDLQATYAWSVPAQAELELQSVLEPILDRYFSEPAAPVLPPVLLTGDDVMSALEINPGPAVGILLDALREAQAVGEVTTRDQALEFIAKNFDTRA